MVCFEFTVQSGLHTFLALLALATKAKCGQQNSASEKPGQECVQKETRVPTVPDEPDIGSPMLGPNVFVSNLTGVGF